MKIRVGFGYDVHQLKESMPFRLGGITIPHTRGALGHSDADVLIHAICDAMLGAAAMGDIGTHFPDTSSEFKGINSLILLKRTKEKLEEAGYRIGNIDSTVCLQKPKIKAYIEGMRSTLAETLNITSEQVSVKATTEEKMGITGSEDGITAYAVVLIEHQ
ncbi:2-C-methyl-D-erythritol 2,4-cyclodiphosphate synthase [Bacteroidota bacterium]